MGFSQHATTALRNNKALLNSAQRSCFKRNNIFGNHHHIQYHNNDNQEASSIRDTPKTIAWVLRIVLVCIVLLVVGMTVEIAPQNEVKPELGGGEYPIMISNAEYYHRSVIVGKRLLRQGKVGLAKNQFIEALALYPNGKKALIGLTESLLIICKMEGNFCTEAQDHLNNLVRNTELTTHELNTLYAIH